MFWLSSDDSGEPPSFANAPTQPRGVPHSRQQQEIDDADWELPDSSAGRPGSRVWLWAAIGGLALLLFCACGAAGIWLAGIDPLALAGIGSEPTAVAAQAGQGVPTQMPASGSPVTPGELPEAPAPTLVSPDGVAVAGAPPSDLPDLVVTSVSFEPVGPVSLQPFEVIITVANLGAASAKSFLVAWQGPGRERSLNQLVAALEPGASERVVIHHLTEFIGAFESVALVDSDNSVPESDENNNRFSAIVTLTMPSNRRLVTVSLDEVYVFHDADIWSDADLFLEFEINGEYRRWPEEGTRKVPDEQLVFVGERFQLMLREDEALTIWVNGHDDNTGLLFGNVDDMGQVWRRFTAAEEWGAGFHDQRSNCPAGCYTARFTVEVVEPTVVQIGDEGFYLPDMQVSPGVTVVWENRGTVVHNVVADDGSFNSGPIEPGGFFAYPFLAPGEYAYHCDAHPGVSAVKSGVIHVAPG